MFTTKQPAPAPAIPNAVDLKYQNSDVEARQTGVTELKGLYVANVIPGCAAANAGIRQGDVIRTIKGVEINTFAELTEELGRCAPGDQVEIEFTRDGKSLKTTATLLNSQGTTAIIRKRN